MTVTVRLFAAAAEAAGADEITVPDGTMDQVRDDLIARHGSEFARVLAQCAVLVDGERLDGSQVVAPGATVDVLPPFAGG